MGKVMVHASSPQAGLRKDAQCSWEQGRPRGRCRNSIIPVSSDVGVATGAPSTAGPARTDGTRPGASASGARTAWLPHPDAAAEPARVQVICVNIYTLIIVVCYYALTICAHVVVAPQTIHCRHIAC